MLLFILLIKDNKFGTGLPHAHMLIWLKKDIPPEDIDKVVSAEIPSVVTDPGLHKIGRFHYNT